MHPDSAFSSPQNRRFINRDASIVDDMPPPIPPKYHHVNPSFINPSAAINYSAESCLKNFISCSAATVGRTNNNFSRSLSCEKYSSSDPISSMENSHTNSALWGYNSNENSRISSNSLYPSISTDDSSGINPDIGTMPQEALVMRGTDFSNKSSKFPISNDMTMTLLHSPRETQRQDSLADKLSRGFDRILKKMHPKARSKSNFLSEVGATCTAAKRSTSDDLLPWMCRERPSNMATASLPFNGRNFDYPSPKRPLPETPNALSRSSRAVLTLPNTMDVPQIPPVVCVLFLAITPFLQTQHIVHHVIHYHVSQNAGPMTVGPPVDENTLNSCTANILNRMTKIIMPKCKAMRVPWMTATGQAQNFTSYSAEAVLDSSRQAEAAGVISSTGSSILLDELAGQSRTLTERQPTSAHTYSFYEHRMGAPTSSVFQPTVLGTSVSKTAKANEVQSSAPVNTTETNLVTVVAPVLVPARQPFGNPGDSPPPPNNPKLAQGPQLACAVDETAQQQNSMDSFKMLSQVRFNEADSSVYSQQRKI
ncbi:hypothetical protein Ciccas_001707 [Cichlidogyrus casuarinus]|uniref:Uncharacterized protein n=1 Tax=Cichlidogyrus casuarinus TaxID=1844966 RepID=A0ABD2QJJ6_9PLAT